MPFEFLDMRDIINLIIEVISESRSILLKDKLESKDIEEFRRKSDSAFQIILDRNINETINELAKRGFGFNVKIFRNPIIQWIYNQLTEARDDITFDAPYLKKKSKSDYYKADIFWIVQKFEGILSNIEIVNELNNSGMKHRNKLN